MFRAANYGAERVSSPARPPHPVSAANTARHAGMTIPFWSGQPPCLEVEHDYTQLNNKSLKVRATPIGLLQKWRPGMRTLHGHLVLSSGFLPRVNRPRVHYAAVSPRPVSTGIPDFGIHALSSIAAMMPAMMSWWCLRMVSINSDNPSADRGVCEC
jgi:hypothetical protein